MEVTTEDNLVLTPITTDAKKRSALTSTSSSTTADSPSPNSTSQYTIPNDINFSKPNTTKTSKPATKKLKRNKSVENIILQLDEILEPTKTRFEEITNKKMNYKQFKFIIENSIGISNPDAVLKNFNITNLEMIEMLEIIKPKIKIQNMKNRLTRLCNSLLDKALSTEQDQE
jgi:hypothetical protein